MKNMEYDTLLNEIVNRFEEKRRRDQHLLVCISGIDASGKSTLADRLHQSLKHQGIGTLLISGDDFFFKRNVRYANPDQAYGYYLESCDYNKLFTELLMPLKEGGIVEKAVTIVDWKLDDYRKAEYAVREPSVVLVEGVFLLRKDLPKVFDYKVWIDLSFREGVKRATRRERDLLHYGSVKAIRERYLKRLYRGQLLHLICDKPFEHCHAVLKG